MQASAIALTAAMMCSSSGKFEVNEVSTHINNKLHCQLTTATLHQCYQCNARTGSIQSVLHMSAIKGQ
eukprot:17078-Heterococcus_DN1.PRE.2